MTNQFFSFNKKKLPFFNKGFTLIESIVAIAVFVLAMGAVSGFIVFSYKTHAYTIQQSKSINEARRGIETMVRELREAKIGDDGSYIIESAQDYEIVFYSDIDRDGATEKVRYFIYLSGEETKECVVYGSGGSCSVNFDNFTSNTVSSAQVEICIEGDLNGGNEYADISADGTALGDLCSVGCNQCGGAWEGCASFDVTAEAQDGSIQFLADGSSAVGGWSGGFCDWQENNHSLKSRFTLSWSESGSGDSVTLQKGVINPTGFPITYPQAQEEITILSNYVRNQLPLFRYYDGDGVELSAPARLDDTKLIQTYLIINIDLNRSPGDFELESKVQIRNLKTNL